MSRHIAIAATLTLIAMVGAGCNNSRSPRPAGDDGFGPAEPAGYSAMADTSVTDTTATADTEPGDPEIDEATAIKSDAQAPLSIPSRRFTTRQQALDFMQSSGYWELYRGGILPQMVEDNLDYADRLLNSPYDYFIVADKQSMHVILYDRYGHKVKQYPMAAARNFGTKHKKSDCRTPEGFFIAQGIYDSTDWLYTDDNGHTSKTRGVYGPRFIRVKAPVTSTCGIHGTGSPGSLGKRVSHGCMRVSNESIMDLVSYATAGMPIIVNPGDRDVAVNRSEGYDIKQIHTGVASKSTQSQTKGSGNDTDNARPSRPDDSADPAGNSKRPGQDSLSHPAPTTPIVTPEVNRAPDEPTTDTLR